MSNRSKGMAYEREYEAILQSQGYTTTRVKGSTKWNLNCDFFGLFDLIAFNATQWVLVQVKSQYTSKVEIEIREWFNTYKPPHCECWFVIRKKGKKRDTRWTKITIL